MEADRRVAVERLSNLGEWEMYRLADELSDEVVCKIALKTDGVEVEYGVWRREDGEPSAIGKFLLEAWEDDGEWGDEAREWVLKQVAGIYEEEMPEVKRGLVFYWGEEEDDDDGEEGEDEEDEENSEED